MTYFELFEIPVQLKVDVAALSKKFFALSKKYHPDYFASESGAAPVSYTHLFSQYTPFIKISV